MAKNYGKWIGAGLGFVMGGPLGALLGLFVGSLLDNSGGIEIFTGTPNGPQYTQRTGRGDFMFSLTVLATAVMKADGKMTRNELNYVKAFLRTNFGEQATKEALSMMKELNKQTIDVDGVCDQIRFNMDISLRTQLLYFLFGIARSDGSICEAEINLLQRISNRLGINVTTFNSVKSMYYDDLDSAYAILGVTKDVTDEELKKAYRKMAVENHPDKVSYLGEDIRKAAEEKFAAINHAYEKIKKQRGIN